MLVLLIQLLDSLKIKSVVLEDDQVLGSQVSLQSRRTGLNARRVSRLQVLQQGSGEHRYLSCNLRSQQLCLLCCEQHSDLEH